MNKTRRRKQRARRTAAAVPLQSFEAWWRAGFGERMMESAHRLHLEERWRSRFPGVPVPAHHFRGEPRQPELQTQK